MQRCRRCRRCDPKAVRRFPGFKVQRVASPTDGVNAECHQLVVLTDTYACHLEEIMPGRHFIDIEQYFFICVQAASFTAIDWILVAFFKSCVIVVSAQFVRHGFIILLDSSNNFIKEFFEIFRCGSTWQWCRYFRHRGSQ